ncbi:hypothetical protein AAG584_19160 [Vreelandella titanicae]|uniref:Uncharacterized protein n=1 Tax=Vreelandella titanicae TaxID=664683 RepID=A0AAP9NM24_9GAMM|nr:hypothetical protein [Halomonas titanicae]QKS24778.1 hypothetical protein FX987_02560 [Halomonas titanicae]SDJ23735.1 hypothetical protein SAMN04487867_12947 [Halomonas titanicae]
MLQRVTTFMLVALSVALLWKTWQTNDLANELALERSALQQMTEKRDEYQRKATEATNQLDEAERRRRLAEADIKALQDELAEQAEDYQALRQRIQRSPASDDGPVAPVLRSTLEALP